MNLDKSVPLVSILIPAYNQTVFLEKALGSALQQDYPNCEIVICDDSTTGDVKLLVEQFRQNYDKISYYNNNGPLGGRGIFNYKKCFEVCQGQYISYLSHDDLYMSNKVSSMIHYLTDDANIKLVTSYRKLIDSADNIFQDIDINRPLFDVTTRVAGKDMGRFILRNIFNVIGEPTTTLFRKADIDGELLEYKGYQLRCLIDVGIWLKLLAKGDLLYIREPLSQFRLHSEQNSCNKDLEVLGRIDWYKLITLSYKDNVFLSDEDYKAAIAAWVGSVYKLYPQPERFKAILENENLYAELMECYTEAFANIFK
ncbi:MAG: glycosyl transferase family protein [Firmicutes bacterium]|nr:glycosyl transferase family protein [Bacillota bacterium]